MKLQLLSFGGESPRLAPELLPDNGAQLAQNLAVWDGSLVPFKAPAFVKDLFKPAPLQTIYRFGKDSDDPTAHWFHWPGVVDVARGPVPDDTSEKTYYTGDGEPRVTDSTLATSTQAQPSGYFKIGLPAPTKATLAVSGTPQEGATAQQVVLTYRFVTGWGEEGPEAIVSDPIEYKAGQTLAVSGLDGPPSGAYNVTIKRLYVSLTDGQGATYLRFWRDVPIASASTTGVVDATLLAEAISSPMPIAPPADLHSIAAHPKGFMVALSGKQICRSEVFQPHAWPEEYKDPVAFDPIGLAISGQAAVVVTRGPAYLVTGQDPLNVSIVELDGRFPGISKRSIRAISAGVVYASGGGLVLVSANGAVSSLTKQFFTRRQWAALNPATMHAVAWDDRYFVFYDNGPDKGSLIFSVGAEGTMLVRSTVYATAAYADPRHDALYLVQDDGGLYKWDAGAANLSGVWHSRDLLADRPFNIGAVRLEAASYPQTLKVYADGVLEQTRSIPSRSPIRLAGRKKSRRYSLRLELTDKATGLTVASSIDELKG